MSLTTIARRYGEALADVAIEHNQAELIEREVRAFVNMIKSSRELYDVFASPVVSLADKRRVLEALIERAGPGRYTANLFRTMLGHYRLHHLDAVYEQFQREINERKGTTIAQVTTAAPLSQPEQDALARKLNQMTGKRVQLQFQTDTSLIGGVITRIGSTIYDGSIRTQLQAVKQRLKEGNL